MDNKCLLHIGIRLVVESKKNTKCQDNNPEDQFNYSFYSQGFQLDICDIRNKSQSYTLNSIFNAILIKFNMEQTEWQFIRDELNFHI